MNTLSALFDNLHASHGILLACAGLLLCVLVVIHRHLRQSRQTDELLRRTRNDLRALVNASVGMGERLQNMERRQRRLAERQEQLDLHDAANQPYEQAIRMAQGGSKTEELMHICGLSKSEAELIQIMHRYDKAS